MATVSISDLVVNCMFTVPSLMATVSDSDRVAKLVSVSDMATVSDNDRLAKLVRVSDMGTVSVSNVPVIRAFAVPSLMAFRRETHRKPRAGTDGSRPPSHDRERPAELVS